MAYFPTIDTSGFLGPLGFYDPTSRIPCIPIWTSTFTSLGPLEGQKPSISLNTGPEAVFLDMEGCCLQDPKWTSSNCVFPLSRKPLNAVMCPFLEKECSGKFQMTRLLNIVPMCQVIRYPWFI